MALSLGSTLLLALAALVFLRYLVRSFKAYFVSPLRHLPTVHETVLIPYYGIGAVFKMDGFLRLEKVHRRKGRVVRLHSQVVSLADPVLVRRVLKTSDLPKGPNYAFFTPPTMAESVFSTRNRDYHRVRRKLHSLSFSLKYIAGLETYMVSAWNSLLRRTEEEIASSPTGEAVVELCSSFNAVTNDVIGATAFGQSFESVRSSGHPFLKQSARILRLFILWAVFPITRGWLGMDTVRYVKEFVGAVISERKELLARNPEAAPKDILQNLVLAEDAESGTRLNEEEITSEALTLLIAGADTTAYTVSWSLYLLATHPQYLESLRAELSSACKDGNFSHEVLKNLPLLNGVISEALRLYPVAAGLTRQVGAEGFPIEHEGKTIVLPPGTEVVLGFWTMNHDPAIWKEASEFRPERWSFEGKEEGDGPRWCRRDAFFPFSEGSRDCIGKNFALQELRVLVAHFVSAFDFRMARPEEKVEPREKFIIAPSTGRLDVIVRRRKD
ncbi:cytochrome P450 [Hyaloraphidium curvatum]|nr:cytochrome P450 [Hyaloraphidium curvatum]